jgi:hypothetical protein
MRKAEAQTQTVSYSPAGKGYSVDLEIAGNSLSLRRTDAESEAESEAEISGTSELVANLALVAALAAFGSNERAFRLARNAEKRKSFRKAAEFSKKDALFLASLIARIASESKHGWCSGCFEETDHRQVQGRNRPKMTCLCVNCGSATTECTVPRCKNFATVGTGGLTVCYCAEHKHEIPSFEKLTSTVETIDSYPDWLEFERTNAKKWTAVSAGVIGGAIVVAPTFYISAPLIGSALGASTLGGSLSGAAATSHGLAMLGGGSLASGGLGMAGGTMVVTATGSALGGILGASTASAYASQDKSFAIKKLRDGTGAAVLLASGFLTEPEDGWGQWRSLIDQRYPEAPVYRVVWGSKELKNLAFLSGSALGKQGLRLSIAQMAKKGSKAFGKLGSLAAIFTAFDLAVNPWTVAKTRAAMTGAILADALARTDHESFVLIGHSLGARVMVTAAQALGTSEEAPRIESMHLLGAAVGQRGDWLSLDRAVSGTIWNYHSKNDSVLKWVYKVVEGGRAAVGLKGFGSSFPKIKDRNVSSTVSGHSAYFDGVTLESTP